VLAFHASPQPRRDPDQRIGDTRATYGYTAYGRDDKEAFTGIDKPDQQDPTKEPYNVYRFNAKRFDPASGDYDMGFRDYDPGLNRFLSRDSYNGALADLDLGLSPWTMNRYGFAGGNPISFIELDGHRLPDEDLSELREAGYTWRNGSLVKLPPSATSGSGLAGQNPSGGFAPPVILPVPPPPDAPPVVRGLLGRALGVIAVFGLLLAGDSEQKTSLDVDVEKRAKGCLQKSGSAPSDAPTYWSLDDDGRATGAEACLGRDAHKVDDRPLRLR
jgi:RHS repeat-associated protein